MKHAVPMLHGDNAIFDLTLLNSLYCKDKYYIKIYNPIHKFYEK